MISSARTNQIMLATAIIGVATVFLFNYYPSLDLDITGYFFLGGGHFVLVNSPVVETLRTITLVSYGLWYLAICFGLGIAISKKSKFLMFSIRDWLYLVLCSIIGPGILANVILKEYSGRARPRSVEEFGAGLDFTHVLNWSEQCSSNCSFISGEVSSMVMIFAPLIFICKKHRWALVVAMFLFGSLSALMRIGQGAHFASDCIMAAVIMIFTAALLYKIVYSQPSPTAQNK